MNMNRGEAPPQERDLLPGWDRRTYATWFLLTVNVLVWLAMESRGGSQDQQVLLSFGAMFGPLIASGEYWRLFTAMFLHIGPMHLAFNGLGLLIFGKLAERIFGLSRFLIVYVFAGLTGSIASFAFNDTAIGAGASGAIMGVLGALAAFYLVRRDKIGRIASPRIIRILVAFLVVIFAAEFVFGSIIESIDTWAHTGGLIAGLALGLVLAPNYLKVPDGMFSGSTRIVDNNPLIRRWWVIPVALAVLVVATSVATTQASDEAQAHAHATKAEKHLAELEYAEALDEIALAFERDAFSGYAHYVRGKILAEQGYTARAISDLSSSLRLGLDPESQNDAISTLVSLRGGRRGY